MVNTKLSEVSRNIYAKGCAIRYFSGLVCYEQTRSHTVAKCAGFVWLDGEDDDVSFHHWFILNFARLLLCLFRISYIIRSTRVTSEWVVWLGWSEASHVSGGSQV